MKILHIVQTYLPAYRYGGSIKSVHELNKWLAKKGVDVTVYTTNIDGPNDLNAPLNQEVNINGVKVFYFKNSFPRAWFYSKYLRKALAENAGKFDIVHSTGVFLMAATLGAYYAKKFKKPFVISPRGSLMREPLSKKSSLKKKLYINLIDKNNFKIADAMHFTTEKEKEEYISSKLPLKKSIVIPNGFDSSELNLKVQKGFFRKKFSISKDKKIILFLSRLSWKKGFDTLIPAFYEVIKKEPKAVLVIAGGDDEGYKKEVLKFIDEINLRTSDVQNISNQGKSDIPKIKGNIRMSDFLNIIFTGMLTGKDKIAAYQDADVFVLPSYSENFGNVVLEALHFNLPVIITKNVGIAPIIEKYKAWPVINKDKNELKEAIVKVLSDNDFVKNMGENGKKLLEKEFSWPQIADRFIKEYEEVIVKNTH